MTIESSAPEAADGGRTRTPIKLNNVTELRLFFAACVLVSHSVQLAERHDFDIVRIVMNSEVAVQGFFILSGYLVFGSYHRIQDPKEFYLRRLLRIYPAYLVAVALFLSLAVAQARFLGAQVQWSDIPPYLLANLTTLNFLHPGVQGVFAGHPVEVINGALWSIKVEMMFYALVPLLYALGKRIPIAVVSVTLIIAGVLWWPCLTLLGSHLGWTPSYSFKYQIFGQLHFFGLGVALFARSKGLISTTTLVAIIVGAIVLLLLLSTPREAAQALGLVVVIASLSSLPQMKDLLGGQDISYGIYLCHFPIIQMLLSAGAAQWPFPLYFGLLVALVLGYGLFSWNYIERPALALRKSRPR